MTSAQIQRFLKLGLEAGGFAVSAAATAGAAIKFIAEAAPDLVLIDLGLPDLDSTDVTRQARAFSRVPITIVSARDREGEKIEALDLGADNYVNKPRTCSICAYSSANCATSSRTITPIRASS